MMQFGLLKGLSERIDYDSQIKDLRYNEQADRDANVRAANKAKMFADDFQYNNAMNVFDNNRVKQFAQFQIKSIGKFVNENPDWENNMQKRATYNQMLRELKDNPELNRGLMSDEAKKSYLKDLSEKSKNPETFYREGYEDVAKQWENYEKFGHQGGKDSADAEGFKEFRYQQPQDKINYVKRGMETGSKLAEQFERESGGAVRGGVPDDSIQAIANSIYAEDSQQAQREAKKAGFVNLDGSPDPIRFITETIRPYAKASLTQGFNPNSGSGGGGNATRLPQATVTRKDDVTEMYTPLGKVETISVGGKQYNVNGIHSTFDKEGNITGAYATDADIAAENNKNKRIREVENNKLNIELQKIKDEYAPMTHSSSKQTVSNALKQIETLTKGIKDRRDLINVSYPIDTDEKVKLDQQQAIEMQAGKLKVHPMDVVNGSAEGKVIKTENDERTSGITANQKEALDAFQAQMKRQPTEAEKNGILKKYK